mgnify:CR=1 FL=1
MMVAHTNGGHHRNGTRATVADHACCGGCCRGKVAGVDMRPLPGLLLVLVLPLLLLLL